MEIIAIANQKGGVGKSTTAGALAAGLKLRGFKTLLVELDPQKNLSYVYKIYDAKKTAYDLLISETPAADIIIHAEAGDILPSDDRLYQADTLLADRIGKEFKIKEALAAVAETYDYAVIDTSPNLGILTIAAFVAADKVVIPSQADGFPVQGLMRLVDKLNEVKKYYNPGVVIDGILLTMHSPRSILSKRMTDVLQDIADQIGSRLYTTFIRQNIAIAEANTMQQDIFSYDAKSNGAIDYSSWIDEFLGAGNNG